MRTLVISDVHANLAALLATLEKVRYDRLICLGDTVAYGPQPRECLECLLKKSAVMILGNHDEEIIKLRKTKKTDKNSLSQGVMWNIWTSKELSDEQIVFLSSKQKREELCENGLKSVFIHNIQQNEYVYPDSSEEIFMEFEEKISANRIFFGHSHIPFIKQYGKCLFVNVGTIGQPRQGKTEATCIMLEDGKIDMLNIPYDPALTLDALRKVPLHPKYIKLWSQFYSQGIVDQIQIARVEKEISSDLEALQQKEQCLC